MKQATAVWNRDNLKNPHRLPDKAERIRAMFSSIAGTYDLLNHLLSLNMDRRWRKRAVELARIKPGGAVLDMCCGTGDMALEFARAQPGLREIVGVDFSEEMLAIAGKKQVAKTSNSKADRYNHITFKWLCADAGNVPLANEGFECVSCAFGIRNVQDVRGVLTEAHRLLKPGGKLVILEFAMPKNRVLRWGYECYFRLVLPWLGGMISRDKHYAYQYLPESVRSFMTIERLKERILDANFALVLSEKLGFGMVSVIIAEKNG